MEKNGMLSEKSKSDFDNTKKAEYFDVEGFAVADAENKHKLNKPEEISKLQEKSKE